MPLLVKDYSWNETPTTVAISVPLKGVKKEKVDIFAYEDYLKVNYPPYLFEIVLYGPVERGSSVAVIENGFVLFKLKKQEAATWGQLCSQIMDDKKALLAKKEDILLRAQQSSEEEQKERQEKIRLNNKLALQKAMDLDVIERERINAIKDAERKQATEELERWKEEQREMALQEKHQIEREEEKQRELEETERRKEALLSAANRKANIFGGEPESGDAVREAGSIKISFTPRVFPTAMRESTKHLEDEWLKKQAEARRVADIEDADLTEEEKDPMFMKGKADKFFANGNYQSAINAYSHAIRLTKGKMPSLYSNRAACHLKVRNLIKAVEDSSKALELLTPAVDQNAASRCKAHIRRGTAFCQLELYAEGLLDYQAALKIYPDNEQLKKDEERIRQTIQGTESADTT